jgi:hypothetical protein
MGESGKNEIDTVRAMIDMYCRRHHRESPCDECGRLLEYAVKKIEKCPFGADKPACSRCRIHCYKPDMRERIRNVMRYAGPRMLYRHPLLALRHMAKKSWKRHR